MISAAICSFFFPFADNIHQPNIRSLEIRNPSATANKCGCLHHLAADFIKCPCTQMCHIDNRMHFQLFPQFFIAGKEHPSVLGNHGIQTIPFYQLTALFHKACKQIALAIRKVLLHIGRQRCIHARAAHIRRIGADHIIFLRQNPSHSHHHFQLSFIHSEHRQECRNRFVQPSRFRHRHQRAVGVSKLELLCKLSQAAAQQGSVYMHHIRKIRKIWLIFRRENAAVVLPCFHHHRKICQLIGTAVDVQPVEVISQNRLCCISLRPTAGGVDVHQHIERIDQNMSTAHARVNDFDLFRLNLPIRSTQFLQF